MSDSIWRDMLAAAQAVRNTRKISGLVVAGAVGAAILSASGKIYTGVSVDAACALGICAERNAILHMITNGEQEIRRVVCVMEDGTIGSPCRACREWMAQLMPENYKQIAFLWDAGGTTVTLGELTPKWWI